MYGIKQVYRLYVRLATGPGGLKPIWILAPVAVRFSGRYIKILNFLFHSPNLTCACTTHNHKHQTPHWSPQQMLQWGNISYIKPGLHKH